MTIARAEIVPFEIPLRRAMASAVGNLHHRHGFLLRLTDDAGRVGHGEASPAYWLGGESLAATRTTLDGVPETIGRTLDDLRRLVDAWSERSPAAACALDTARLDLETRERGLLLTELLGGRQRAIPVAALLVGNTPEDLAGSARDLVAAGYRCVKLKVGITALEDDVDRLAAVRGAGGSDLEIRLDANRAWTLEQAQRALAAFATHAPDFVEEPLVASASPGAWRRLRQAHGVGMALDESVETLADLERFGGAADVLVLKAARVGGPSACMVLGTAARRQGLRVLVTDSIESSVGRSLAIHLAAALHAPGEAVGLGGASLLRDDPLALMPARRASVQPIGPGLGL